MTRPGWTPGQGRPEKPRQTPEHDIQTGIVQWARAREAIYPALAWLRSVPSGGHRLYNAAVQLKLEGMGPGVPDLMLPVTKWTSDRTAILYCGLWLEVKAGNNKLSPDQHNYIRWLRSQCHVVEVVYSIQAGVNAICSYLDLDLERIHD